MVVELRQYTLKPGQRDVLIDIFDRHPLEAFYDGPIWTRHKSDANDTMLDSNDVLRNELDHDASAAITRIQ